LRGREYGPNAVSAVKKLCCAIMRHVKILLRAISLSDLVLVRADI
jgi:hypothetical protein